MGTDGASLFYTSQTRPETFTLLRSYLLHRLYAPSVFPPVSSDNPLAPPVSTSTRFPFLHRANILDREQVLVPAGWDSWGKIEALGDGFDPSRVVQAWEVSIRRSRIDKGEDVPAGEVDDEEVEDIEDMWEDVVPDLENGLNASVLLFFLL